nr:PREDICTED: protoporphyrinogen oxidase [Megachile rotundata]
MTAILGAGISGLSAAYYGLNNPKITSLVIFEASNRVGGWIRSLKQPDGTIFEQGPRVIRANSLQILELVEELELSAEIIPVKYNHDAARNRYIYSNNALHCVPNSISGLFTKNTLLNRPLTYHLWKDFKARKVTKDDESVYNFMERRFGKDLPEKLIAPVFCGIYGGDIHELSAKSCMTSLFEAEQKHGSIVKGLIFNKFHEILKKKKETETKPETDTEINIKPNKPPSQLVQRAKTEVWRIWGIEGGFEQLPQKLAKNITERGINIKMQHTCEKLTFNKDYVELTVNGKNEKYSQVISSLPAKNLANLVQEQHPHLSKELCSIPTVSIAVVNLQFSENVLPISAFGVLVPPKEKIPILGVLFDSCVVPQNSKMTVLTVMMGGAWFQQYFSECSSEEQFKTVAIKYVKEILGIDEDPKAFHVSILKDCIPQYTLGHEQRLNRIRKYIAAHKIPLVLCGSSYQAVGVPDVILSAKQAVSDIN